VLSETAEFLYKTTNYYHPESDRGIIWNDPNIGIVWPERENIVLSKKDINQPNLSYSFSLKQLLS
ncbi:TPA: dTDP-4-dehydrorhamnose 3,5-epimerase family protein, partial [Escherichia coli]